MNGLGDGYGRGGRRSAGWLLRLVAAAGGSALAFALIGLPAAQATSTPTVIEWGGWGSPPDGLTGVTAISAQGNHSLALRSDGTVVGWGSNLDGESDVPVGLSGVMAIAAGGEFSLALRSDGTVVGWGYNGYGELDVPGLSGVVAIAAGSDHSLALKADGTVVAWGLNSKGQASVPDGLTGVTAIAARFNHSLALTSDGTIVGWGSNGYGELNAPAGLTDATAIAIGDAHSLALKTDGTVVAWGADWYGQTDVPTGLTDVTAIAAGAYNSLALKGDGTVVAWGLTNGPPPGLSEVTAIAAGTYHNLAIGVLVGDHVPPVLTTPDPAPVVNATSSSGAAVTYTATAVDAVDGPVSAVCDPASGTTFPLGTTTVSCSATDQAGNTGTATFPVMVTYAWSGVLQPVNADNSSIFKAGSTIPVKFAVTGASASITDATARLSYAKISDGIEGDMVEATSTAAATSGNLFRYTGGQYIFNWSTKRLTKGTFAIYIDLGDGAVHVVHVSLK